MTKSLFNIIVFICRKTRDRVADPLPLFLVCKKYTKPWALHYSDIKQRLNHF